MIILSMASKQKVLDKLKSDIFQVNVYQEYIDNLIDVNLDLIGSSTSKGNYLQNIEEYLKGNIDEPDEVIESLINNK